MSHPHDIYSPMDPWTVRITYLASEFAAQGHEVKLVYHLADTHLGLDEAKRRQDYPFETIPQLRYSATLAKRIAWTLPLGEWADVVHFQKCFPYAALPAVAAGLRHGKPIHYDWDDWEYEIYNYHPTDARVGAHIDYLERKLPSMVDTVSVASDALRDLAIRWGVRESRIFEAHVGADLDRFRPDRDGLSVREAHDIEGDVVLYLGQLHGAQYCELFLQAAAKILDQRDDVTFMVVGSGGRMGELHALTEELNIGHKLVLTGAVNHAQVPDYVAAATVAVACFEDNAQTRTRAR